MIQALLIVAVVLASLGAPAAASAKGPVSLVWGGDVTLGSSYGLPPDAGWPQLAAVAPVLRGSDLAALNYEGTFGSGGSSKCEGSDSATCFSFQAPARNARTLRRAGVDIVNTANNHAYDFGPSGYRATRAALSRAGILATGSPGELRVLRRNGTRVAFVGFSTYSWSAPMSDESAVRSLVARAARRAEVVVVFMHAGAEGAGKTTSPPAASTPMARIAAPAGASRASLWTQAPTSCSARDRTCSAARRHGRAARRSVGRRGGADARALGRRLRRRECLGGAHRRDAAGQRVGALRLVVTGGWVRLPV